MSAPGAGEAAGASGAGEAGEAAARGGARHRPGAGTARDGRTRARLCAVQTLFAVEFTGADPLEEMRARLADGGGDGLPRGMDRALLESLVAGVGAERDALDARIAPLLDRREGSREPEPLLRVLLRAGAWELTRRPGAPPGAVLSEYVGIARALGLDSGARVLNGALAALAGDKGAAADAADAADDAAGAGASRREGAGASKSAGENGAADEGASKPADEGTSKTAGAAEADDENDAAGKGASRREDAAASRREGAGGAGASPSE